MNLDHYTYRVTWSPEDGEHVGLCLEFPSLSWLADSPEKALAGIRQVVVLAVRDMLDNGEEAPQPMADREYSGKFQVRVPPAIHRTLVMKAAEEGVSLNRFVSAKLAV
ncbi:MAG: type II toxin-antitoxin system HicB family antitoxin [Burkholderiales bacterium]|nr:type II toxin-antitoxin system HicB family antitoxin [Burkholderiales bacterium]